MANDNRNKPDPYSNSDQKSSERPGRRGEDIDGEGELNNEDFDPSRKSEQKIMRNNPGNEGIRNNRRGGYYGSPYDVGNYASHYDQKDHSLEHQSLRIGEQPSQKRDFRGKGARSYQRSDKRILEDVNDRLYIDPYIDASDIEVKVNKGDVTLTGTVKDRDAKRRAEDLAEIVPGVKNVENRLRVIKKDERIVSPERNAKEESQNS